MPGREALLAGLPPEPDVRALWREIQHALTDPGRRVVVLDDDPTGVQTVHDVDVLTTWDTAALAQALERTEPLFYVLTNSRALAGPQARALAEEIATNLANAAAQTGVHVDVISRSDSTLRGHYPGELEPLAALCGPQGPHGVLIVPAFAEGGRITVDGIHYVAEGDRFVPAGETDFARDPSFGYTQSGLAAWVEEKTHGRWRAADVLHVPIALLRAGDPDPVTAILSSAQGGRPIVADCAGYADLTVLVAAVLRAERQGHRFLCRTAASFVKVRGAIADRPLLHGDEITGPGATHAGLVLVGSYVKRTAEQLDEAIRLPGIAIRELSVSTLLEGDQAHVREVSTWAAGEIAGGRTALVYTSRTLVTEHWGLDHTAIAARVSVALTEVARSLHAQPAWLLAKGGITSSDVATRALGVRRARVLGQIATGVPVWQLGSESRFPGMSYIIFPGNVGTPDTLAQVIATLDPAARASIAPP